jgi:uncharacterized protein YbjT (DUF2867 family)
MSEPVILVAGATGKQGGAVARHLIARGGRVRALTRKVESLAAAALQRAGAQVVAGDLNDKASLVLALTGVDAVFSVQDFWAKGVGYEGEVRQGKNLVDAAAQCGVAHLVQSAMARSTRTEGIEHFESKKAICAYLQASRLPHTIIGTVWFMDNVLDPKRGGAMTFPVLTGSLRPSTRMHMLAVDDLGAIVARVFIERDRFLNQHLDIAGDCLTVGEMKSVYARTSGRKPKSWALPAWALRMLNKDFAKQLAWQNDRGWSFELNAVRAIHPALTSFEEYLARHGVRNL